MNAADLCDLAALAWVFAMGFIIGRGFGVKATDEAPAPIAPAPDEETITALGRGLYGHCQSVWFAISVVGSGFACSYERKLRVNGKPDLTITITGEAEQ